MASRIRSSNGEAAERLNWLVANRPEVTAKVHVIRNSYSHQGEVEHLDNQDIPIREIPDILQRFPSSNFEIRAKTHEEEAKPCDITATFWTITKIGAKPDPKEPSYIKGGFTAPILNHILQIHSKGGLEVYSFYCDD